MSILRREEVEEREGRERVKKMEEDWYIEQ